MALYLYKAINENGNQISGEIEAGSRQEAMESLVYQGHIPESVKKKVLNLPAVEFFQS